MGAIKLARDFLVRLMTPRLQIRRWKMRSLTTAATLAMIAGAPIALATAAYAAPGNASQGQSLMKLVTDGTSSTRLWQRTITGGDAAESWRVGDITVTAAGPPGSIVTARSFGARGKAGGAVVSIALPAIDKKAPDAAAKAVSAYARSGRSVGAEAEAVGHSPADSGQLQARFRALPVSYGVELLDGGGPIIGSGCASTSGDGGNAWGHACIVQYLLYANGWDWYIGDDISGSGSDSNWLYKLSELQSWDYYYDSGNQIVSWNPSSSLYPPVCEGQNFSLTFGGVGVSSGGSTCPDRIDPVVGGRSYGTKWSGFDTQNYVEGTPSVDIDHSPPWASSGAGIYVYIAWTII